MNVASSPGFARRFVFLWGLLTLAYAFAVAYRAIVFHSLPGLPAFAAFSAIAAVWLDFSAFARHGMLLRLSVLVSLLTAAAFNAAIVASRLAEGRPASVGRSAVTLLFLGLFYVRARAITRRHA